MTASLSRRHLLAASATIALAFGVASSASAAVEIQWWHAMGGALGEKLGKIAEEFNKSQSDYKVVAVNKGTYAETMTGGIAAYRAGNAPHIIQVFEVGTATMMAAKGAVKPVYQMMKEAGEPFDSKGYLPAVTGYYSTPNGEMLSFPFNSSTPVLYINKDAFKKAGLDPDKPPRTWPEVGETAKKLRAAGLQCGWTSTWMGWIQVENFSAYHNVPLATKVNGMAGMDTELKIDSPLHVKHVNQILDWSKDKTFVYGGRRGDAQAKFTTGECGMLTESSAGQAGISRAKQGFEFGVSSLPYWPDAQGAPQNTIIGGASLWVMGGKKPEEYRGVAKFMAFLSQPEIQMEWHTTTGYVPITQASYVLTRKSGYYDRNPGADLPVKQLTHKTPTANSKGLRFGNFVQGREVIEEEMELVFAGKKDARTAMNDAVKRGNEILRKFQAANR